MDAPGFLGLSARDFERAPAVAVLPIPLELTVTFGGGTARGPAAILEASQQVELYDRELGREPVLDYGVATLAPLATTADPATAVDEIARAVAERTAAGAFVLSLGGEHTLTVGAVRGVLRARPGGLTVVQIDAHADLRARYAGSAYNHACVARRLLEESRVDQILQLGIRSVATEEAELIAAEPERLRVWWAEEIHAGGWVAELEERLSGRDVYLSIDVDGLDPALVPATGTPEPGGLDWSQALAMTRAISRAAMVVGMDCVELAPSPGLHHADFAVAKLLYKTLSFIHCPPGGTA
ncbi:MAG: agmatinase [Acidobacteriota bacterium]|nr:agmatinase [Acidobacteriota bacterium]